MTQQNPNVKAEVWETPTCPNFRDPEEKPLKLSQKFTLGFLPWMAGWLSVESLSVWTLFELHMKEQIS